MAPDRFVQSSRTLVLILYSSGF